MNVNRGPLSNKTCPSPYTAKDLFSEAGLKKTIKLELVCIMYASQAAFWKLIVCMHISIPKSVTITFCFRKVDTKSSDPKRHLQMEELSFGQGALYTGHPF